MMDHTYISNINEDLCALCDEPMEKLKKEHNSGRRKVTAKLRNQTVTVIEALQNLHQRQCDQTCYTCDKCYLSLERDYRTFMNSTNEPGAKRCISTPPVTPHQRKKVKVCISPGIRRPVLSSTPKASRRLAYGKKTAGLHRKSSHVGSAVEALRLSKYTSAFRHILSTGKAANQAFDKIVRERVFLQMRSYVSAQSSDSYPQFRGARDIEEFSWDSLLSKLTEHLPTLSAALKGSLAKNRYKEDKEKQRCTTARLGMMFAVPLYNQRPVKFSFIQTLNSIQMWRSGCSNKLFKCFNQLGLCQSTSATERHIDTLVSETDATLAKGKASAERKYQIHKAKESAFSTMFHDTTTDEQSMSDYTPTTHEQEQYENDLLSVSFKNIVEEGESVDSHALSTDVDSDEEETDENVSELGDAWKTFQFVL